MNCDHCGTISNSNTCSYCGLTIKKKRNARLVLNIIMGSTTISLTGFMIAAFSVISLLALIGGHEKIDVFSLAILIYGVLHAMAIMLLIVGIFRKRILILTLINLGLHIFASVFVMKNVFITDINVIVIFCLVVVSGLSIAYSVVEIITNRRNRITVSK